MRERKFSSLIDQKYFQSLLFLIAFQFNDVLIVTHGKKFNNRALSL